MLKNTVYTKILGEKNTTPAKNCSQPASHLWPAEHVFWWLVRTPIAGRCIWLGDVIGCGGCISEGFGPGVNDTL